MSECGGFLERIDGRTYDPKQPPVALDGWQMPAAQWALLREAYAQPERAYHHLGHVWDVLEHCATLHASAPCAAPRVAYLAACYHDAVYVPGRRDNEQRSAGLLREHAVRFACADPAVVERAEQWIVWTARHGQLDAGDVDTEAAHFLDADMAILAASPEVFARYDAAIAAEYRGVVPGFIYRFQRRRFLRGLSQRPVYLSAAGQALWSEAALRNLRAALR